MPAASGKRLPSPDNRFVGWALAVAVLPPLVFAAVSLSWWLRCPPSQAYLGYLQEDQPRDTAFARAVFQRGNGMFYANPFDYEADAPRVLTNLGYIALAWLIGFVGGRDVLVWEVWRFGFGIACYGLFAMLVARLFRPRGLRWWVFGVGAFGAGAAWVVTLTGYLAQPHMGWLHAFKTAEAGYDFWRLNLFRQSLYPLELAYHGLFFAALLSYLERLRLAVVLVIFLLWWTHPVTALLATTIVAFALVSDIACERKPADLWTLLGIVGVVVPWVLYYRFYLPRWSSMASWIEQTLSFRHPLELRYWPRAWGVLVLGLPAAFLYGPLRRYLWRERDGRLVMFWGIGALGWAHNNLLFSQAIQPMHFTRGYIHLFLLIVSAKAVQMALERQGPALKARRRFAALAWWLMPVLMADNMLFVARMASETPRRELLVISPEEKEVLDHFRAQPGSLAVLSNNPMLGTLVVAKTAHRVFLSERAITPFYEQRDLTIQQMIDSPTVEPILRLGLDRAVLARGPGLRWPAWADQPRHFRVLLDNGRYRVGEFVGVQKGEPPRAND